MREMTVRIRFTTPSLGCAHRDKTSRLYFARSPAGNIVFLAAQHKANMTFAAQLMGKYQHVVGNILWDVNIDGRPTQDHKRWYRRVYETRGNGKSRYALHEAFQIGHTIGINCVVPQELPDEDFWSLLSTAGRFKGLSPYCPGEFGLYEVVGLRQRLGPAEPDRVGSQNGTAS